MPWQASHSKNVMSYVKDKKPAFTNCYSCEMVWAIQSGDAWQGSRSQWSELGGWGEERAGERISLNRWQKSTPRSQHSTVYIRHSCKCPVWVGKRLCSRLTEAPPFCEAAISIRGFQSPRVLLLLTAATQRWRHIFCSPPMDRRESMTPTTRDSGKCPVPVNISGAPLSLPQRACLVHSKSEGAFLERVSEVTCYRRAIVLFPLSDQPGGGMMVVCKGCVGAGWLQPSPLPSVQLHFWTTLSCNLGFPQTWAWAWGRAGRMPRLIKSKGCPSCHVTNDYNLHSNISRCILLRYPGSV